MTWNSRYDLPLLKEIAYSELWKYSPGCAERTRAWEAIACILNSIGGLDFRTNALAVQCRFKVLKEKFLTEKDKLASAASASNDPSECDILLAKILKSIEDHENQRKLCQHSRSLLVTPQRKEKSTQATPGAATEIGIQIDSNDVIYENAASSPILNRDQDTPSTSNYLREQIDRQRACLRAQRQAHHQCVGATKNIMASLLVAQQDYNERLLTVLENQQHLIECHEKRSETEHRLIMALLDKQMTAVSDLCNAIENVRKSRRR
ncbi:hypothetical protein TrispH2_011139 [Trichoplax sp. H2]|nr:hypothetical protein TrispH2_011139 [Trichoplax sp. H2]|eukprot:RDD37100.1 hypothetical protein TrispH2_011139 [Trichoplax sp. H2]